LNSQDTSSQHERQDKEDFKEIDVPIEQHTDIVRLLKRNSDLFAKKDADLGHTDTVKMKIDTGNHRPIKN